MNQIASLRLIVALAGLVVALGASPQTLPLPPSLIRLDSEAGARLLVESQARRPTGL